MNKLTYLFALLFLASILFISCGSDNPINEPNPEYIVIDNEELLEQIVFANEESATSVSFTTLAAWTATVAESATQSTRNVAPTWVTIAPESGNAGANEIEITLETNTSGADRTVVITIRSGDESITITITQRYVKEDGTPLLPPNQTDEGVVINGIRWATRNVDMPGTFADNPEDAGMFFQWNRCTAWAATGEVEGWDSSLPEGTIWERENDPCPTGWRVPTRYELQTLLSESVTRTWATQNGVNGFSFGAAPNQLFLPASGLRDINGVLSGTNEQGRYWSSTDIASFTNVNCLMFNSFDAWNSAGGRAQGFSVRCVEDVSVSVSSISLSIDTMTLPVTGITFPIMATVAPVNATDIRVVWSSSNETVATVSANGVITATETTGNTTITATTACGSHTATVAVTVTPLVISSSLDGVVINGIRWATRNVNTPGTFAAAPHSAGMFYQWNRHVGWSSTNPMVNSNGDNTWDNTIATGTEWERANDPCPQGWRVPTQQELASLNSASSVWITYNGVCGRLYGTAPNVIFLPALGWRGNNGALGNVGSSGHYWSSSAQFGSAAAMHLWVSSSGGNVHDLNRAFGFSVRCVAE